MLIVSCQDLERAEKPKHFLNKEEMTEVLTDIYFLEGARTSDFATYKKMSFSPQKYIFTKHGIDSTTFRKNLDYYSDHKDKYMDVLEMTQARLEQMEEEVAARLLEKENKQASTDSTRLKPKKTTDPTRAVDSIRERIFRKQNRKDSLTTTENN